VLPEFVPVLAMLALAVAFAAGTIFLSHMLGPRHPTAAKSEPYECGVPPVGDARERFPVKFFHVAMLFIIFDLEAIFLYPWAIVLRKLGLPGLATMGVFLGILIFGLVYVWKRGALDWTR
jgi:NADH-quinone oxidoreductase subunit A